MALKDTIKHLRDLLCNIQMDLEKADKGNKAASQRVRTGTVRMEKVAKHYRKESVSTERKTRGQKKPAKKAAPAKSKSAARPKAAKIKARPKTKSQRATFRPRAFALKRPTAKLPMRRFGVR